MCQKKFKVKLDPMKGKYDPIRVLESNECKLYNHGIKKLVKSQKETIHGNYIICDTLNEHN